MAELAFPLLTLGATAPLVAAAVVRLRNDPSRTMSVALGGAGLSAVCALEALRETAAAGFGRLDEASGPWLFVDGLSAAPLALYALIALGLLLVLPKRDRMPSMVASILLVLGATFVGYTAGGLPLLLLAWCASALPLLLHSPDRGAGGGQAPSPALPLVMLSASALCLAAGIGLMAWDLSSAGLPPLGRGDVAATMAHGPWAFGLLMLAVLLRKGLFPFHSWAPIAFQRGPLLLTALILNGHLGAYLVARAAIPLFPQVAGSTLSVVSDLALLTAIYAAVVALAERDPRRLIGLLAISQASFVLAGLESGTAEGTAGGLIYWMVVAVATTTLATVYRLVEVRVGRPLGGDKLLGLARQFPRLAVFFLISGLALVGMPGTLGFCADELLLHGAMESHPQLGLALPLATALNAFHIFRLFTRLFLGSRGLALPGVPDARPVERWVLTFSLLLMIGGGLFPAQALALRARAAEMAASAPQGRSALGWSQVWTLLSNARNQGDEDRPGPPPPAFVLEAFGPKRTTSLD